MNHATTIPELISFIVDLLLLRHDLLHAALVCRAWCPWALDRLWGISEVPFDRLLKVGTVNDSAAERMGLPWSPQARARFLEYARRVRNLRVHSSKNAKSLIILLGNDLSRETFADLERLTISAGLIAKIGPAMLPQSLKYLEVDSIDESHGRCIIPAVQLIEKNIPHLASLVIRAESTISHPSILPRSKAFTSLHLFHVVPLKDTLLALSNIPALEDLEIKHSQSDPAVNAFLPDAHSSSSRAALKSLKRLRIKSTSRFIEHFVQVLSFPNLRVLSVSMNTWSRRNISSLETMVEGSRHITHLVLEVQATNLDFQAIRALYVLPSLESIRIEGSRWRQMFLDDEDITTMSHTFPKLRELVFNSLCPDPFMTTPALLTLVTNCPSLEVVQVSLVATEIPPPSTVSALRSLKTLDIPSISSPPDLIEPLAEFLFCISSEHTEVTIPTPDTRFSTLERPIIGRSDWDRLWTSFARHQRSKSSTRPL
ncbi:hypothetical protein FRB99_008253 [Tulasnella sp. 403]|nr:hypothetical protein FRB99_008253 [Tulasnella sp. 403]